MHLTQVIKVMTPIASELSDKIELGTVVSLVRVSTMPGDLPSDTRFIGLEDIAPHEGQIISLSHVSKVRSRVFQFQNGDVLYGRLRPYLVKAAVADFDGSASGEIIVLRCTKRILPGYLLTLLLSEDFTQFINERTKGDRPRTSFATIASYQLNLPSLEAQVEVCDRDSRLVSAVSRLSEALMELERAAASLMEMTRTRLIWGGDAEIDFVPLADLVDSIDYGTSKKSTYGGIGTPVLRIPNIMPSGEIDAGDLKYTSLNQREVDQYCLKAGDLLLIRSNGSLSLVGQAAKVGEVHEGHAFAGYLLRMHPRNGVLSDYLLELVRSSPFRRMIESAARSSTGINNLSAGRLAAFPVPPLQIEHQKRIVDMLARLQGSVTSSSEKLRQAWLYATALQKTARRGWLGHSTSQVSEPLTATMRDEISIPDHADVGDLQMSEAVEDMLLRRLDTMPSGTGSFETLTEGLREDYDTLRDAVFKLLAVTPPRLEQIFDERHRSIVLRRSQ
jgi:type I restriction enzyme S subunit